MNESDSIFRPRQLAPNEDGELLRLTRRKARWESMSFFVRRLLPGDTYHTRTKNEEAVFILLGGLCRTEWGLGVYRFGKRGNVFEGLPSAVSLPAGNQIVFTADTTCEIAECRVPSSARHEPTLVLPSNVVTTLRGQGNPSRQIVNVITPSFPAGRIMAVEVYTQGGDWWSYPPHNDDAHNPPSEVNLDEIYYYRIRQPDGFAFQHLYSSHNPIGCTIQARDGDAVLVRSGFHPVIAAPGYDVYYLNFLAASSHAPAVPEVAVLP